MERYSRNICALSESESRSLEDFRVCIIGCGGLGEYLAEMLGRLGIGHLTLVDGDVFQESNLNRQIYSDVNNMGKSKVEQAKERMQQVNPLIQVMTIETNINENNAANILKNHDVVIDALDNREARLILQDAAEELSIPLVHGAIAGWYGQVTTILPGDRTFDLIYRSEYKGVELELGNPAFIPALVASIQVSEVIKILINRGELLRKKLLLIDLLTQEYNIIPLISG